jgi:hypothetical protein
VTRTDTFTHIKEINMNSILLAILISVVILVFIAFVVSRHMRMYVDFKLSDPEFEVATAKFNAKEFNQFILTNFRNGILIPKEHLF